MKSEFLRSWLTLTYVYLLSPIPRLLRNQAGTYSAHARFTLVYPLNAHPGMSLCVAVSSRTGNTETSQPWTTLWAIIVH